MKTSELTGIALDQAVGSANGETLNVGFQNLTYTPKGKRTLYNYSPSTKWAQGGPIIEREDIGIVCQQPGSVQRCAYRQTDAGEVFYSYGPTPLIAAMRCYVASKLGDDVEIPTTL